MMTGNAVACASGALLAGATRVLAFLRPARKPLHPDGDVLCGRLLRHGSEVPTGVAWLDRAGEDDVTVRLSRAIGLPGWLPDVHGLALRVRGEAGGGDVLLASTGWGRITRFVLTMSRRPRGRPLTTLLPYRTDSGPVLLGARGVDAQTYELAWARPTGKWHGFGVLHLSAPSGEDADVVFDPVQHQINGLRQYAAVVRLREPAYRSARRSRDQGPGPDGQAPVGPPDP